MSGIYAAITGRCGRDAERKCSKSGTDYATASVAVDVAGRGRDDADRDQDEREPALWVRVLAFGRTADALAVVRKGETVHACGRLERGRYTSRDGEDRESWSLLADSVLTARPAAGRSSNRDGGRTRDTRPAGVVAAEAVRERRAERELTEDDIPF